MKTLKIIFRTMVMAGILTAFSFNAFSQDQDEQKNEEHHHNGMKVEKKGDDSVVIYINKHDFDHFPMGNCNFGHKRNKYNGHWAGIELGWNGYVNSDFNMDFPASQQYLNMNVARSLMVNVNPFELNLNIVKNHFGFTSGLGFQFNNYYFTQNYMLSEDSSNLMAYKVYDDKGNPVDLKTNKMTVSWLNIPILFEYQTNPRLRVNSFHFTVGVIGGVRIGSYQKQEFDTWNTFYYLRDENSKTVGSFYADKKYIRDKGAYYLNSFKLDATARIGWSFLNFFATYSLTPMFQENHAPTLYPWSVGITLLGW